MDGEHDRVMKYLMSKPENKGKSRESVQAATRRQYFRKHERKVCPEPVVMMRSIVDLFKVFSKAKNPKTGYTFLSSGWRSVLTKELKYVAKGYLSDKPDISYYTKLPTKLGQLQEFRCNRGNSALEGYHVHLRRRGEPAVVATTEFKDIVINEFDMRWSVRSSRDAGLDTTGVGHYNLALIETYDASRRHMPYLGDETERGLPGYTPLVELEPIVHHGAHFSHEAWMAKCEDARSALEVGDGTPLTLHATPTMQDTKALLELALQNQELDYGRLSQLAHSRGLLLSRDEAQTWVRAVAHKEDAFLQLSEAGYGDMVARLRGMRGTDAQRDSTLKLSSSNAHVGGALVLPAPATLMAKQGAQVAHPKALPAMVQHARAGVMTEYQ